MYQLALIMRNAASSADEFQLLVVPMHPPSRREFPGLPHCDSDLWDLPCAPLSLGNIADNGLNSGVVEGEVGSRFDHAVFQDVQSALDKLGLKGLEVASSIERVKVQIPLCWDLMQPWKYWKLMEEPDYGPGSPLKTLIFMTEVHAKETLLPGTTQWLTSQDAWNFLIGNDASEKRVGPLAAFVFSPHLPGGLLHKFNLSIQGQEYPPGVLIIPMDSKTLKPFRKTNLVIIAPSDPLETDVKNGLVAARGDALIVDPGCHPAEVHTQLSKIVRLLPKRLIVFLTHHHVDHTEGLPTVGKQNTQAVLVAHETTIRRMGKVTHSFKCVTVVDGSKLLIGDQELLVIAAPGHTDGHMALLHNPTRTLIAGDHCVGQGSSILDSEAGGNMQDYLETTHRFLDLAPRVIVPMHGHFNLWPAHMLCGYIRHREAREVKILEAVENGARSAYEIVSDVYSDTSPTMWMGALSNVKLHVEHLAYLQKLPEDFSIETFKSTCGIHFHQRYLPIMIHHGFSQYADVSNLLHWSTVGKVSLVLLVGTLLYSWAKRR